MNRGFQIDRRLCVAPMMAWTDATENPMCFKWL
jgi:tRNA-dihydrouridine synthase